MTGDVKLVPVGRLSPVEQHRAPAHSRDRGRKRYFLVEIEDPRRVDERRDQNRRRPVTAMVAQAGAANPRDFRLRLQARSPRGAFSYARKPVKRIARKLRIAFAAPRVPIRETAEAVARRAFMLQRTMLR